MNNIRKLIDNDNSGKFSSTFLYNITKEALKAFDCILAFDNLLFKDYLLKIRNILGLSIFTDKSYIPDFLSSKLFQSDYDLSPSQDKLVPYFEVYERLMKEFSRLLKHKT